MAKELIIPATTRVPSGSLDIMSVLVPGWARGRYYDLIKTAHKYGDFLYVKVSLPKHGRSTGKHSQNHHINGHIRFIAEETGQDFESIKLFMKMKAMDRGYSGDVIGDIKVPKSEADASVEDATFLIDTIHQWSAEWSILLPEEDWDEQEKS